jgi:hypothetical protein
METYRGVITLDVYKEGFFIDDVNGLGVDFTIEIEHREWGVKDINMHITGKSLVTCIAEDKQTGEQKDLEFEIDWSQMEKVEWNKGGHYSPDSATIYLNADNTVDYKKSYVDMTFLSKESY